MNLPIPPQGHRCVIEKPEHAAGSEFEVDKSLAGSTIRPLVVYHARALKFTTMPDGPRLTRSGFNADVSIKD